MIMLLGDTWWLTGHLLVIVWIGAGGYSSRDIYKGNYKALPQGRFQMMKMDVVQQDYFFLYWKNRRVKLGVKYSSEN